MERERRNTHDRHVDNDHSLIVTTNKTEDTIQTHSHDTFFHPIFNNFNNNQNY